MKAKKGLSFVALATGAGGLAALTLLALAVAGPSEVRHAAEASDSYVATSLAPVANADLNSNYPSAPTGPVTFGGVPFEIPAGLDSWLSTHNSVSSVELALDVAGPKAAHLLINSYDTWSGWAGATLGFVRFDFQDGASHEVSLVVGSNVREWREANDVSPTVNTVTDPDSIEVFSDAGSRVIDKLTIDLPSEYWTKVLTSITVGDTLDGAPPSGPATSAGVFWMGLTLEMAPTPTPTPTATPTATATPTPTPGSTASLLFFGTGGTGTEKEFYTVTAKVKNNTETPIPSLTLSLVETGQYFNNDGRQLPEGREDRRTCRTCDAPSALSMTKPVPAGGEAIYLFEIAHDWDWIPPLTGKEAVIDFLIKAVATFDPSGTASGMGLAKLVMDAMDAATVAQYTYSVKAPSIALPLPQPKGVEVRVDARKEGWLQGSLAASVECSATLTWLNSPFAIIGGPITIGVGVGAVFACVSTPALYEAAFDPEPDFAVLPTLEPIISPEVQALEDGPVRQLAEHYLQAASLLNAASLAQARAEAARLAGSPDWEARQLGQMVTLLSGARAELSEIDRLQGEVFGGLAEIDAPDWTEASQALLTEGVSATAASLLSEAGFSADDIAALGGSVGASPSRMGTRLAADLRDLTHAQLEALNLILNAITVSRREARLVAGWNQPCYVGPEQSIDDALGDIMGDVLGVYRLNPGQTFGRWFPGRPEVSNITTVNAYEPLFILMAKDASWLQTASETPPASVNLAKGWSSLCYLGETESVEDASASITSRFGILYMLGSDQAWSRFVPNRPELSNIPELAQYDAVLLLVNAEGGVEWVFNS